MTTQTTRLGKQHLLEVAEKLFTQHGYRAVSIRDIAKAGGVTNAAIYYHFPNKEALFDEVIENHADKLALRLQQASSEAQTTRKQIAAMLTEYATFVSERRSLLFSLRRKPDEVHHKQNERHHGRIVSRMLAPIEKTLKSAVNQGELRDLPTDYSPASLLLGLFHGMLQHRINSSDCQIKADDIEIVIDIFWDGLKPKI